MNTFKCPACGKTHGLESEAAENSCRELMAELEASGGLDYRESGTDPELSTSPLFTEARGQMFGILICAPPRPGEAEIILKAFSGQYNGRWTVRGWVPPILDPEAFRAAVSKADPLIKALGVRIKNTDEDNARSDLIDERRMMSRSHMREIHEMYKIRNFTGGAANLSELFPGRGGIPAGTGDCCAPKLLNYAVLNGLRPLSLAEFFWGRENRSGTKQHGHFYPPCDDKCRPILGYMLCGADYGA